MKKLILATALTLSLMGCASQDYSLYAKAQSDVAVAKHNSDAAKYKAMGDIASSGTDAAKVAAVMAMAMGQTSTHTETAALQAPQQSSWLQWAQVLVPSLTQIAGISANMRLGMTQSDNAAKVAVSTNDAFVGIAGKIQAAPSVTTTTTNTTTDTHAVTTNTDSHAVDNHTTNPVPVVINQPVVVPNVIAPATRICTGSGTSLVCQ